MATKDRYAVIRVLKETHDKLRLLALLKDRSILGVVEELTEDELAEIGYSAEELRRAMQDAQKQ